MSGNLFELSLNLITAPDWAIFEKLASKFIAVDYSSLRTMASPSGDQGRDSELFSPDGDPTVCFQYSVSGDWLRKIKNTQKRLRETFPKTKMLIYVTNIVIGAKADKLRQEMLKEGHFLDIYDQNWFLERQKSHQSRTNAADEIIERIAMPYIKEYDNRKSAESPLDSYEARTALTYISLQLHDDQQQKGLTKVCFDALVRAALRNTSKDASMSRDDIHRIVSRVLPSARKSILKPLIDASLDRLKKSILNHNEKRDTFYYLGNEDPQSIDQMATAQVE